ncbi:MAG: DegV family protein [Clostridia bacterium]|nr:DegV family protein [Clostridia bacterium]
MSEFVILTDSGCDLTAKLAEELELVVLPLSVTVNGKEYHNYLDEREISHKDFYALLRAGNTGKTSAINLDTFKEAMNEILKEGKDILYLGFYYGLSGTYQVCALAAEEMAEKYPERKILHADTLCASLGQGLLIYHAVMQKRAGKSIEEVRDFVLENRLNLAHWFTVDDLNHLKRGGRVSAATAMVDTLLSIKPVLHVDDEGHLINMEKARGRKASIQRMAQKVQEDMLEMDQPIFISHGDCQEEAEQLADLLRGKPHIGEITIGYVGPVIGAHSGAGTLAVFYLGKKR